eukprot:gene2133-2629_t
MWPIRGAKFIIKRFFGQYFQYELERDQFDIGFKNGTINLSNLELNVKRINQDLKGLPICLASGYVGEIMAKVPYTSLWDSPSEFNIKNLELSFVSVDNYENIVLPKLNEIEYNQNIINVTNIETNEYSSSYPNDAQYYSDEDEELDKQNDSNSSRNSNRFNFDGLEALSEILKKLFDKVSAKIDKCTISLIQYSHEHEKTFVFMLQADSIEYSNDQNSNIVSAALQPSIQQQEEKNNFFIKRINLKNYRIQIAELDGNAVLSKEKFYNTSITNFIPSPLFQTIFTNQNTNQQQQDSNDYISVKFKRNENLDSIPLFNMQFNFKEWTFVNDCIDTFNNNSLVRLNGSSNPQFEINQQSDKFKLDQPIERNHQSPYFGRQSPPLLHQQQQEEESSSTQFSLICQHLKVNIKFPDLNSKYLTRPEILIFQLDNFKTSSNFIKDIKDYKWLIDFNELNANLQIDQNQNIKFLDIKTKDHSQEGPIPLEITVRGDKQQLSNESSNYYDVDLNSSSPILGEKYQTPSLNSSQEQNIMFTQHYNPFSHSERHKGPFSSFVSTSEGIFEDSWPDEAEQEEINSFRHSSIESSKYVFNIILPEILLQLQKNEYELLVKLLGSYSKVLGQKSSTIDKQKKMEVENTLNKNHSFTNLNEEETNVPSIIELSNLFSVFLVLNSGKFIFKENPIAPNPSIPNILAPHFSYQIDFKRFEIFCVSQYCGKDIKFINSTIEDLQLFETDLSMKESSSYPVILSTIPTSLLIDSIPRDQFFTATISINNDTTGFLDKRMNGNIYSFIFKGATIHHNFYSVWYSRLPGFFSITSDKEEKVLKENIEFEEQVEESSLPATSKSMQKMYINFVECSTVFTPTSSLVSSAVLFFSDIKLKILNFNHFSCIGQNSNVFVLDDIGLLNKIEKSQNQPLTIQNYWKLLGYIQAINLDYFEFEIPTLDKPFAFDYNHNVMSINVCSDSFYTLNQLISNFLGLDIPLAEVADLIITQGITPDLKENIDILINEDSFSNSKNETQQVQQPMSGSPRSPSPKLRVSASSINTNSGGVPQPPNLEFEDFEDDPSSFQDSSDDDGTFYEYQSPIDLSANTNISDSTTSSEYNDLMVQDLSSQNSSAPIVGSVMIEDYDHDKLETFAQTNPIPIINEDDGPFYVDLDSLEDDSSNNPNFSNSSNNLTPNRQEGYVSWLDSTNKFIEPIENYISKPEEDPSEDCELPLQYPKSMAKLLFRNMDISLKIFKGNDWDRDKSNTTSTSTTSTKENKLRDPNSYVEFILSNFNLRFDSFDEKESYSKRMSLHITNITIMDHIPTSLWNKFLCSDTNVTRYQKSPMIKILFETVRPDLSRPLLQENRLKVLILPIRFNIDQDTVSFMINFFSYQPPLKVKESPNISGANNSNKNLPHAISRSIPEEKAQTTDKEAQEITYFQSVEILPLRLKIDYKPKKIDYHKLTSGNYTELFNLLPLEGAIFNLVRLKLNGVGGWGPLFNQIGKIWLPHIIQTQLLGYVYGVKGLNSLVHIGEGLANLIVLPIEQYKKDGKVFKGIKKGTTTFLKNLTVETLSVGAKVAVGTQGLLETADNVLSMSPKNQHHSKSTSSSSNKNQAFPSNINIPSSKLSDQPTDTREGFQHAYESLSRELRTAAHTIIAIPMKEYQQKGTKGYVKSIVKAVPIAIIRPMIGITEGVSKTLLGVRNQIDPLKKTEMDNKYKSKQTNI